MQHLLILSLVVLGVCGSLPNQLLDSEWEQYKRHYGKNYFAEESRYRRLVWERNLAYIAKHNREFDMGIHSYTLGQNEYADMTSEEFVARMNGYRMRNVTRGNLHIPKRGVQVPDSIDWRTQGYVTEVKNQGSCGSCWAFSTTGSLEGQHFKKTGKLVSLSEQNLVDCSRAEGNQGCQGGLMDNAFNYIKKNNGIDTEESYPYKGTNGQCHFQASSVGATLTSYTDIKKGSEDDLLNAVGTVGPVSVAIDASHLSFQLYRSGVYDPFFCSSTRLDHGVLAVGYGSDNGRKYWLVKNSWGKTWGQKGYIWMARDARNKCGIATSASYPVV
ncbi:cathepsin L1 [Lingula anatina]|uniref:Cathepsin L1 n=1 Tax=Lingula anatina TaxID=7574 RepID=A0A1S3JUA0_LINAN|nr:cathepsin L1 [Lingula anatina]|eukprot:XP_013413907.1 cathepsin L1 [Lingula anatina]